jgi:hypothetical protein
MPEFCLICIGGSVSAKEEQKLVSFCGYVEPVDFNYLECSACGSVFAGEELSQANKAAVQSFRDKVNSRIGLREEYLRANQKSLAVVLGVPSGAGPLAC